MTKEPKKGQSSKREAARPTRKRAWAPLAVAITGVALTIAGAVLILTAPTADEPGATVLPDASTGKGWFENVAPGCGVDFHHVTGAGTPLYMPESMVAGVCLFDFDRDDHLDVYFVQGGSLRDPSPQTPGNQLYRNRGDGTFVEVTAEAGVGDRGYGVGCTCGDYNNDGWTDIYVTNTGPNVLYRNDGDGTFTDVTAASGVGDPGFNSSAAFVDYDHDGDLDLFVVDYVSWSPDSEVVCTAWNGEPDYCTPNAYKAPGQDTLYQNNGDGTFTDASQSSGVSANFGNGLGVVCGDLNGDGWVDIAVANDLRANQLWMNSGDGTFYDEGLERGAAYSGDGMAESGMGIDAQDVDHDGDLDLFMTHFGGQTNTFYLNEDGFFVDRTTRFGLGSSLPFTGFGTALIDLNNDGWLDIYVANGRVIYGRGEWYEVDPYAEPNQLFEGLDDGTFREVMPLGGTDVLLNHSSRGAAFGDYDNDGDIDIFVANRDGPGYVLRNVAPGANHWITFRVVNEHGSDAIGARVEIEYAGKRRIRDVRAAYSYCASSDPRVHFGLGDATHVENVTVRWTNGEVESFGRFDADRVWKLETGAG
ncbi:MAG: CRTAC1 family protein [Phycisphaerae bacterium]|jgi:hypothetical protein